MIPTLILFGLVFGRWWGWSLVAAAVGWPVLLAATGVMPVGAALLGASALAVTNTAVGVCVHQVTARIIRRLRRHSR
ncbi:hypothetical protein AMIS_27730 [Actinoplanes missouriensis 431]|uniref:Uncharacterized protein n=1 Tax=Actinoplanes missouriensis (strain ATCC 14538 / DSM 43046 / CBS 188.64 / JCM 3121 / NBRC 102363 / NCIMB 12654 / NRRL B-3342 / UNCC 431) TaxID=512565 RepID=I0H4Q6_ACTM4|nr:hypothetical protein [Actinoplanes missouriensis]BAL87993.1 hypothetical protein AMIS_27730 [Actinoplanes missouriensis 431]